MAVHNLGPVHVQADCQRHPRGARLVARTTRQSWKDLDDDAAGMVMAALRNRMDEHARHANIRYTQAIVNQGREAGASLAHPHGQLLGMPFVPGEIADEERAFARFEGGCILCVTVEAELADGVRVVVANDDVRRASARSGVARPTRCSSSRPSTSGHLVRRPGDRAGRGRARHPRRARPCCADRLGDVAYNLVFHTAPHQHGDAVPLARPPLAASS